MTAKTIAQNAIVIAGLGDIDSIVDANDKLAVLAKTLLNRTGRSLVLMRNAFGQGWVSSTNEYTFDTVADQEEYALPADFVRFVDGTIWDRDSYYEARGPLTPHEWQAVRSGLVESATLTPRYRLRRSSDSTARAISKRPITDLIARPSSSQCCMRGSWWKTGT